MSGLDIIKDVAKQTLSIRTIAGNLDDSLWDRCQRLVRNVEYICKLPEVDSDNSQIDQFCLHTATYFSDAGLAVFLQSGKTADSLATSSANAEETLDLCIRVAEEKLASYLDQSKIKKIIRIISESTNQFTKVPEAMILSDARNLDDMGAVGIFNELRRYVVHGKCISDALKIWKRKTDYRYWQARLKKSFRFESVRKLAEQRLSSAEFFMNQLKVENSAHDLGELVTEKTDFAVPKSR